VPPRELRRPSHRPERIQVGVPSAEAGTSPHRARRRRRSHIAVRPEDPRRLLGATLVAATWPTTAGWPRRITLVIRPRAATESHRGILNSFIKPNTNHASTRITTWSPLEPSVAAMMPAEDTLTSRRTQSTMAPGSIRTVVPHIQAHCHITSAHHHSSSSTPRTATPPSAGWGWLRPHTRPNQVVRCQGLPHSADGAAWAWHHLHHGVRQWPILKPDRCRGATQSLPRAGSSTSLCVCHPCRHRQPQHTCPLIPPQRITTRVHPSRPLQ